MTPFHNMALMCPQTTLADVDMHTILFREAIATLVNADAVQLPERHQAESC